MSIIINAKGTSVPYFGIGKGGITLYQGTADPSGSYTINNGDYWFNSSTNSINVRTSGAWASPSLGSLHFPTSSGSSGYILSTNGSGVLSWIAPSSGGTVTSVSVTSANGFAGTVATSTSTPVITLSTTASGVLKGNGTSISAAITGTDYSVGTSALATGILKSTTSTGALSIAVAGDFPTLNQNTTGTSSNVTGTVAVTNGGTGLTSLGSANQLLGVNAAGTAAEYKTITAGTAIGISNAANSITINNTGVTSAVAGTNIAVSGATGAVTFSVTGTVPSATNATNVGITDDTITNASVYPTWVSANTGNLPEKVSSTKLSFNPSTGLLTSTGFSGSGANLTNIPNSSLVNSSILVTGGTGISTSGSPVSLGGTVTVTNTGVTSNVAGTGISVSGATGAVTVTNTGVTSAVAGTNIAVSGATGAVTFSVTGTVPSSTSATNATNVGIADDTSTNATVYPTWVTANTGNLPEKVSSTKLSFNPSTGLLTSSAFTTPGNLTFTGTSNRITGDFSNATHANRVMFQSSTTNSTTSIGLLPNGAITGSQVTVYSSNDPANSSTMSIGTSSGTGFIASDITGSGTYRPIVFNTSGATKMLLDTSGNLSIGNSLTATADIHAGKSAAIEIKGTSSTNTAATTATITTQRSRGTIGSPSAISSGDTIGVHQFSGFGTSYLSSANIIATASETFTGSAGGTSLAVQTTNNGAVVPSTKMTISHDGNLTLQATGGTINNISSINSGQLAGFRNRVINGAMMVDQRNSGGSITPTASAYTVDRWSTNISQASKLSYQQVVDAPAGFYQSMKVTVASQFSPAAGDSFFIRQFIEANNISDFQYGTATAQTAILSFWVKSSVAGTYSAALRNAAGTRSYIATFSVTSSWTNVSITIPGDTGGTWLAGGATASHILSFDLGAGSNSNSTAGAWTGTNTIRTSSSVIFVNQTVGSTFNFTGVQLELGSVSTPYEQRFISTELALCQRYYERLTIDCIGYCAASTNMGNRSKFVTTKRATPTIAQITNNANFSQSNITPTTSTYFTNAEGVTAYRPATASTATQFSELIAADADY